jgi:hypothetical protein
VIVDCERAGGVHVEESVHAVLRDPVGCFPVHVLVLVELHLSVACYRVCVNARV